MIFKVISGQNTIELNPELQAIPEFTNLTERQLNYVILSTDYKTPFRKLPLEERKTQAAILAGYKLEKDGKRLDMNGRNLIAGKVAVVEAAINRYSDLQRDEDYETLLSITELISQIRVLNRKKDKDVAELGKTVEMNLKLDKLFETKKKIEEILDKREDAPSDPEITVDDDPDSVDEGSLPILSKLNQGYI